MRTMEWVFVKEEAAHGAGWTSRALFRHSESPSGINGQFIFSILFPGQIEARTTVKGIIAE